MIMRYLILIKFNDYHAYFQRGQKEVYIEKMLFSIYGEIR